MLNLRLQELDEVVDFFIIVEGEYTHKGDKKELKFDLNKFLKFKDKIIYKKCSIAPVLPPDPSNIAQCREAGVINERNQRYYLKEGFRGHTITEADLIILSDVDEIPDSKELKRLKEEKFIGAHSFFQNFYYYNYKCKNKNKWAGSVVLSAGVFKTHFGSDFEVVRNNRWRLPLIEAGWHFSYFGDENYIIDKIKSFSHQEYNSEKYTNPETIKELIREGKDLFFRNDEKFEIVDNQTYLPQHIHLLD